MCGSVSRPVPAEPLLDEARAREAQNVRLDTILEISATLQALGHSTDDRAATIDRLPAKMQARGNGDV